MPQPTLHLHIKPVASAWAYDGTPKPLEWFQAEDFPNAKAIGAFHKGTLVGTLVYEIIPQGMIWLDHVFVQPEHRRHGVFRKLARYVRSCEPTLPFEAKVRHPAVAHFIAKSRTASA